MRKIYKGLYTSTAVFEVKSLLLSRLLIEDIEKNELYLNDICEIRSVAVHWIIIFDYKLFI